LWANSFKFATEWVIALVLLIVTAPLMLLAAVLVKLTSSGPVLYSQTRLGKNRRFYRIYKIRTMIHNCEDLTGPQWSRPGDSRITLVGRFLRQTHIDELPQLWNVLRGDMSLVGPRPERPEFATMLQAEIAHYRERLVVRPGVTGLAQVQLPPDTDLDGVRRKLAYDLYYVQHLSLVLDVKILLSTCLKVFGARFITLRKIFGLPSRETVENHLADLSTELEDAEQECDSEPLVLEMQPAEA
jgi:lipopolysaccharide/colanic/teichoic acid biosynthesis glycosyltransferase